MDAFYLGLAYGGIAGAALAALFVAGDYMIWCMDNFGPGEP